MSDCVFKHRYNAYLVVLGANDRFERVMRSSSMFGKPRDNVEQLKLLPPLGVLR